MDLYGDLDKYTNVAPTPSVGLGFTPVSKKEAPSKEKKTTPSIQKETEPSKVESTPKSAVPSSALKFVPHFRRREDPSPKQVAKPSPLATTHNGETPISRYSPASSTLKTALGMAAFTPVSVTRKPPKETPKVASPPRDNQTKMTQYHIDSVREEYNPFRPNDYAAFSEEREIRRKNAEVRRDLELRERRMEQERLRERQQLEKDLETGRVPNLATTTVPGGRGRGMNLPAWMMKKIEENSDKAGAPAVPTSSAPPSTPGQFDDAPRGGLGYEESPRGLGFVTPNNASTAPPLEKKPRVSRFGQRVSRFDQTPDADSRR
ncbi:hypothetical protein LEN26_008868 [Aphanomyces euteiches]|nr:hypothetical protein LEN26_008868 [Aphanomyces euteiches]